MPLGSPKGSLLAEGKVARLFSSRTKLHENFWVIDPTVEEMRVVMLKVLNRSTDASSYCLKTMCFFMIGYIDRLSGDT